MEYFETMTLGVAMFSVQNTVFVSFFNKTFVDKSRRFVLLAYFLEQHRQGNLK
jgi:hypothetical protein